MKMLEFLFVPTVLFLTIVAPIWIVMHYANVKRSSRGLNRNDLEVFEEMLANLDNMADRIEALESILEHDHPQWSKQAHRHGEQTRETKTDE